MTVASGIQHVISAGAPTQRIRDKGQQHLPGDETWLIGEQRASGEKKYYLARELTSPLPTKDGGTLRTIGEAREYMAAGARATSALAAC